MKTEDTLLAIFKNQLKNPLYGYLIVSEIVFNWKSIALSATKLYSSTPEVFEAYLRKLELDYCSIIIAAFLGLVASVIMPWLHVCMSILVTRANHIIQNNVMAEVDSNAIKQNTQLRKDNDELSAKVYEIEKERDQIKKDSEDTSLKDITIQFLKLTKWYLVWGVSKKTYQSKLIEFTEISISGNKFALKCVNRKNEYSYEINNNHLYIYDYKGNLFSQYIYSERLRSFIRFYSSSFSNRDNALHMIIPSDSMFDKYDVEEQLPPSNDDELREWLIDSKWHFSKNRIITLLPDMKVSKSWGSMTPDWEVDNLTLQFEGKGFKFSEGFKEMTEVGETEFAGSGKLIANRFYTESKG